MEDTGIVELYWSRDAEAITQTSAKYGGYCYTIAYRILADNGDAEECVNDTWMGAWNAMPVHRPDRLGMFLGKIARRLAIDRLREKRALKRGGGELPLALDELEGCVPAVPGADRAVEDKELEELIDRFLHTLPAQACNVFLRRYWYVEPLEDIAQRYGMNVNTVKTSLFRTRNKLRRYLEEEGIAL